MVGPIAPRGFRSEIVLVGFSSAGAEVGAVVGGAEVSCGGGVTSMSLTPLSDGAGSTVSVRVGSTPLPYADTHVDGSSRRAPWGGGVVDGADTRCRGSSTSMESGPPHSPICTSVRSRVVNRDVTVHPEGLPATLFLAEERGDPCA